jgi:hypothetical protein
LTTPRSQDGALAGAAPIDADSINPNVRRVGIGLAVLIFGIPILLAGFIIAADL